MGLDLAVADECDSQHKQHCAKNHNLKSPRRQFIVQPDYNSLTVLAQFGLFGSRDPAIAPAQCQKKYGDHHWPTEHRTQQPNVIFKVTTIITPTVAIDN